MVTMQKTKQAALRLRGGRHWPLWMVLGLSACGGGGGGGFFGDQDIQAAMTLSQVKLSCDRSPGEGCDDMSVTARLASSLVDQRPLWTEKPAPGGIPALASAERQKQSDGSWLLTFTPVPGLAPGTYTGEVEFSIFELLTSTYRPVRSAYKISVAGKQGKLDPLRRLAGAPDWEGYNGNAAHTGLVPVTLDPAKFSRRWTWIGPRTTYASDISPVVSANGLVYFSSYQTLVSDQGQPRSKVGTGVTALAEADGGQQWNYQESSADLAFGPPAVSGAQLALMTDQSTVLLLDAVGGTRPLKVKQTVAERALTSMASQTAPTLFDGNVYIGGNTEVMSVDARVAAKRWSTSLGLGPLATAGEWTPAVNAGMAYANIDGEFSAYRAADGVKLFGVAVPGASAGGLNKSSLNQAPLLVDAHSALLLNQRRGDHTPLDNSLSLVDLNSRALRWTVKGQFTTQPVAGNGVIYVGNHASGQLEARAVGDGALLWSWALAGAGEERFMGDLLLTNNLLFVAAGRNTYAIDLATRKTAWTYRMSGTLALSPNGVLYIARRSSAPGVEPVLSAINLQ